MPHMPQRPDARSSRRRSASPVAGTAVASRAAAALAADDRFFRHIVSSMRNGVIAVHRGGALALMNDEAYRIFALTRQVGDIGRPFADVLSARPDVIRVLGVACERAHVLNSGE